MPFSTVTIGDTNANANDTLTITLAGGGTLADGTGFSGLTSSGGSVYTLSGSASAITSELDALIFTPVAGSPNSSATTTFALSDKSSGDPTATTNDTTSVNVSTPAVAPTITGTVGNQTLTVGSTDTPFSTVTIGDTNANANDTLTITLAGGGTLADGTSFSGLTSSGDVYTLTGSASAITSELDAVVFTPGAAGAPNTAATTAFALNDTSSGDPTATADESLSVNVLTPAVAPTITGTLANQSLTVGSTDTPFSKVTIGDANANATDTLTITLTGAGTLADGAGFSGLTSSGAGVYTLTGAASAITSELDALAFTPAAGSPGSTSTTTFTLRDISSAFGTASGFAVAPTVLAVFNGTDGSQSLGGLIEDAAGDLFGTTEVGGASNVGVVFEIAKSGSTYAAPVVLASFNKTGGWQPDGNLVLDATGDLFGATYTGGANDCGAVFEIAKTSSGYASQPSFLASFNLTDGSGPIGGLVTDSAGDLFGDTVGGGANDDGVVFEIVNTASGYASTPTVLASLVRADGYPQQNGMLLDASGDLFGTASLGGANGDGTVYEIAKTGSGYASTPMVLISFNWSDGNGPASNLIMDASGDLFGTTDAGGANGDGVVFEIAKTSSGYASTPTVLASFNGSDGYASYAGLLMDAAGDLFGTTNAGGANHDGVIFEIAKTSAGYNSTPIVLANLSYASGDLPYDALIADAAGDLLGTTANGGGVGGEGTVLELLNTSVTDADTSVNVTTPGPR